MKKGTIRIIVLSVVFIIALFVTSHFTNSGDADLTADMETASLPTISFTFQEQKMNQLAGYVNEMDIAAVREPTVPLNDDGKVSVNIQKYGQNISKLHYEILSIDGTET